MRRTIPAVFMLTATACLLAASGRSDAQGNAFATLKGKIVWGGDGLPEARWITPNVDMAHCLKDNPTSKNGKILDESLIVNPKNMGLKNVFVYILDTGNPIPIHANLKNPPKDVVLDQPACAFFPHAVAVREGQTLVVKNSAPVQHNIRWIGNGVDNQGGNVTIKAGDKAEIKDLKAQKLPLPLECNIHGWMKGRLLVVNHPYFAVTDGDGNFEIKLAPVGNFQVMIYHEEIGYRLGVKGKNGEAVTIKAGGGTDLGELKMGK